MSAVKYKDKSMMCITLQELQEQITAGRNKAWNEAVGTFGLTRTPEMGIEIRRAFLLLGFRHGQGIWFFMARPFVTKDNALNMMAESYQIASLSYLTAYTIDQEGKLTYPTSDGSEKLIVASMPVGLLFIGPCSNGNWVPEFIFVEEKALARTLKLSVKEGRSLLEDFVFDVAEEQIQKLQSN